MYTKERTGNHIHKQVDRLMNALLLFLMGLTFTASAQQPAVEYVLGMPQPWTHLFEVETTFRNLPGNDSTLDLRLPVWRTGRYVIFDFAAGIVAFSADDGAGNAFQWEKIDKSTWRVHTTGKAVVRARYSVYANEFSMRTRGLNDEHGFVDGTSVFMYVEPYRNAPVKLTVRPYGAWHVTTGLDAVPGKRFHFVADGYDHLVDCPMEIGNQTDVEFMVEGKKHILSVAGTVRWDQDSVVSYLQRIVMMNKKFWGDLPYDRYIFMFHATPSGGGGTEHINSAAMGISPFGYDRPGGYGGLIGLVSHEFFHTWNVKRLRPRGMDPYDWTKENYYKELWIAEGGTSYMHGVLLTRSGIRTTKDALKGIAISTCRRRNSF